MSVLNWDAFEKLPGAVTKNWELLCRELVRRNYARFGRFRSFSQQPGIEFSLILRDACDLGPAPNHWGWQCRWYDLDAGKQIGTTRRKKIEAAIRTTEKEYPTITDWVLWTRRPLTPTDQKWFDAIATRLTLHPWAEEEVIGLLVGDAEILKATYFGELVLTPEKLEAMHDEAIAPVKMRWEPQLHIEVDVERSLKAALGSPGTWPELRDASDRVKRRIALIQSETGGLRDDERKLVDQVSVTLSEQCEHLDALSVTLDENAIGEVWRSLETSVQPPFNKRDLARLAARLRAVRHPASLSVAAVNWEISNYFALLNRLSSTLERNLFAVLGDPGFGKTFLAAELTDASDAKGGGVLLLAKHLPKNGTLDDLARRVSFGGDRMQQLIEAVDAAGARSGRRIPILIDGLNESENPSDWKDLLSTLAVQLRRTSHCAVIVTVRTSIGRLILPDGITEFHLTGFRYDPLEAIRIYFKHYKIEALEADLPLDQLSSPLFLRLFCEATNPGRTKIVGPEHIPRSPTAVFESYRSGVVSRAAEALNIVAQDVEAALERVALALWDHNARFFDFDELRRIVGDDLRGNWRNSLARVLEEEGILSRDTPPGLWALDLAQQSVNQVSAILYDALAGFMIADALLAQQGHGSIRSWLSENWRRLDNTQEGHHPLADDIVSGMAGLLPRRFFCQLWECVPSPVRERALLEVTNLEASRIDEKTLAELSTLCGHRPIAGSQYLFYRLWWKRSLPKHPLNSHFLEKILRPMLVAQRDLIWTEWLRTNREKIVEDLQSLEERWQSSKDRSDVDSYRARWVCWTLTSTVRYLRDQATKALYWYGLGAPRALFEMAIDSLTINDPYVADRLFAAAYGVVMGYQKDPSSIRDALRWFLQGIASALFGCDAASPANHWMIRMYVSHIVEFAQRFLPDEVPSAILTGGNLAPFSQAKYASAESTTEQFTGHLGMDFENYEVGGLFADRGNYDFGHDGYSEAVTEIRGRVWDLGYREADFERIDADLRDPPYARQNEPSRTERYAKKYGWIGLYEKAGILAHTGILTYKPRRGRGNPIVDIDPSFPRIPRRATLEMPDWTAPTPDNDETWLGAGEIVVPDELLKTRQFADSSEAWIAVDGCLHRTNPIAGRRAFGFIRALLVDNADVQQVVSLLRTRQYLGNHYIPEKPSDHYTFAGEIPWSSEFAADYDDYEDELDRYRGKIGGYFDKGPTVEILAHQYAWEDYHCSENRAGGHSVPSKSFSHAFGLAAGISSFRQYAQDGSLACLTVLPPEPCDEDGAILYIRQDLLMRYAADRNAQVVFAVWGERNLTGMGTRHPAWARAIYERHGDLWRRIVRLEEIP